MGADDKISKYGDWFTHDRTARAKIFRRDHTKIRVWRSTPNLILNLTKFFAGPGHPDVTDEVQ